MSRRIKVMISAVVAVVVLTVGSTATVMANGEATPPPEAGTECFLARVAQILGITWEDLTNAFEQARQELWEEHCIGPGEQVRQELWDEHCIGPGEQVQQELWDEHCIGPGEQLRQRIRNEYCIGLGERLRQRIREEHCIGLGEQLQQQNTYRWRAPARYGLK